jgi:hypothetical protein
MKEATVKAIHKERSQVQSPRSKNFKFQVSSSEFQVLFLLLPFDFCLLPFDLSSVIHPRRLKESANGLLIAVGVANRG